MVDDAHTLHAADTGGLWEIALPAGTPVTCAIEPLGPGNGYGVELINHSTSTSVYYQDGDTAQPRGRGARVILPGNANTKTFGPTGGHITFVADVDAKVSVARP